MTKCRRDIVILGRAPKFPIRGIRGWSLYQMMKHRREIA